MLTYLRNAYVEIIQISYYSDHTILSYKESARFNGTTLIISSVSLSVCPLHMCAWEGYKIVEIFVLKVYKSDLARCGGNLYKPVTLNFALFAWNSFYLYILQLAFR